MTNLQKPNKYQPNDIVQNNGLYGELKEENLSKKYLNGSYSTKETPTVIPGEEHLGIQKTSFGGIIISTESIGEQLCCDYNARQIAHIKKKTFAHKALCERNNEATGLLFLTLWDMVQDNDYKSLSNKDLCVLVQNNIQSIVEEKLYWIVNYSKHVVRDYYSLSSNRLKIKLNFILDDGIYEESELGEKTKGGLLMNGLLQELEYYDNAWSNCMNERIGMVCQVLSPSGLPRNKKWIQIDVGISFIGKRKYKENIISACIRQAKSDVNIRVHDDVIKTSIVNNKIYYGSAPNPSYEGYEIYIWEILYKDQLKLEEEERANITFCKCEERYTSIENHKRNMRN